MDEGARHRIERIGKGGIKIRRLKGSGRDIVHPYEAMVDEISRQIMTADQAIAERKLADFTGGIKGGGGVFEKVPRETKIIQFKYDELRNGLKKTLNRTVEGYPELMSEIDALFDAIGGEQGNLYRAGGLNPMQRIVFRDGKAEVWEYKDPWIRDSFVGADKASVGPVIKAMQLAAKVARFGMTVLNPDFAFRNWLRDTSTRFINTEGNPTIFIPDMAKAMVEAFGGKSAEYKLYQASGGPLSGLYGTDINAVKKAMTKVEAGNWYYIKHPWEAVIDANAFLEDVSRFAEFKAGYGKSKAKAIADNVKAGMNKEQAIRDFELNPLKLQKREAVLRGGLAAREGTIDFLTSGASARKYNEVTAFFTANMGGLRKVAMMLKQNPSKTLLRGVGALTIPTMGTQ
jgi:hypothetical protein